MTSQEHMAKMTTAIRRAIKVMGDRFGSTEQDVASAIQDLKASIQVSSEASPSLETLPRPASQSPQNEAITVGT